MIKDFDNMIADLGGQIATEEDRTKIKGTSHPAYSMFATAAAKRRQNLLISVAHIKSMLDIAKREFDQVTAQLHDLEPTYGSQLFRGVVESSSIISRLWWLRRIAPIPT